MAVNYEKYIQVLARSFEQLYADMAKKQTDSYVVKASRETDAAMRSSLFFTPIPDPLSEPQAPDDTGYGCDQHQIVDGEVEFL